MEKLFEILIENSHKGTLQLSDNRISPVENYVFIGLSKLKKTTTAIRLLYNQLEDNNEMEFSIGILLRSLLMDMILFFEVKKIVIDFYTVDRDKFRKELETSCSKFLNDGTKHIIDSVKQSQRLTEKEKQEISQLFSQRFPDFFQEKNGFPSLIRSSKVSLPEIFANTKDTDGITYCKEINGLYSYYSKYDHLSCWTMATESNDFGVRKNMIDTSLLLVAFHLMDLLLIGYHYNENNIVTRKIAKDIERELETARYIQVLSK